jgi:hypothetical protein
MTSQVMVYIMTTASPRRSILGFPYYVTIGKIATVVIENTLSPDIHGLDVHIAETAIGKNLIFPGAVSPVLYWTAGFILH